jgi:hypothetical protein
MPTWSDAYKFVADRVASKGLSNRDAAGLILFARRADKLLKANADPLNIAAQDRGLFNWYANSLQALGWAKRGDRFDMSDAWQKQPYVDPNQLMAELGNLASMLDAAHVPFKVEDPSGSDAKYRTLALDAYHTMQKLDPASADQHHPPAAHKPTAPKKPKPKKPSDVPAPSKTAVQPVAVDPMPPETPPVAAAPQKTVQPPPVTVDHPDGHQVAITPPPVVVPHVASDPGNIPPRGTSMPVQLTPPPVTVPPLVPGGTPVTVQPPPVYAQAPVVPHPADVEQPGDWYWRKHAHDNDPPPVVDETGEMMDVSDAVDAARKKKKEPAGSGDSAGILLLLAVLALSD